MAKLFLFAIGGTGSRVVKALTMLMASGVEIKNTETIIPIIIDPDSANGDLTRTVDILKLYKEIREKGSSKDTGFFQVKLSSLDELGDQRFVSDNFKFDIDGVKEQLFKDFIGYSELDRNNRAFASLLFSKANLEADMEVGFKGNPNIGSVVLNKFKDSDFFRKFASNFEQDDRIFIISSIFGGTGAAGFPLILKNIREARSPVPHHHFLQHARIGAVTVLPYFGVDKNEQTSIDSNTFISKTKAALSYYARNVSGNNSINALYYIGDKVTNDQKGADGAHEQRNKAHFIELAAALSIVDFMELPDADLQVDQGRAVAPRFYEFGLKNETQAVTFDDMAMQTYDIVARPVTCYALFRNFMEYHYEEISRDRGEAWASNGNNKLATAEMDSRYKAAIHMFNKHFAEWVEEMSGSNVAFRPVNLQKSGKDLYNLVNNKPAKKSMMKSLFHGSGLDNFVGILSKKEPEFDHLKNTQKLMALFYHAAAEVAQKEIGI
ncbi:hypothetical protein SAMN04488128_1011552 [Chitinophaga eiseniae]|uniref:Tubulin/FtsZ family, GTPase domain n=1 Tax=Chitinophaga eiseniae TaxID=634771 RepID=A0A1T4NEY9_9BACT|nr:hypothetical protein [Chitinophaga eiseniae]SJZ77577.1 hypothetical protein SAMN04488128_1011552 [Chitinophaga eiseniae]